MNYEIREMQPSDGSMILDIYQHDIESPSATFEQAVPDWESWDMTHLKTSRFVLEDDQNRLIGWCALRPVSQRPCYSGVAEVSIYTHREYQGKGLGTMLLKKLILDSEMHNLWTLQLNTFPENEAGIALFKKLGFKTVGICEKLGEMNGIWRDVLLMERRSKIVGY